MNRINDHQAPGRRALGYSTQDRVTGAVKSIDSLVRDLEPSELRKRFLALECRDLLLGFLEPVEAAKALKDHSQRAVQLSPSLAQVALVHSINPYEPAWEPPRMRCLRLVRRPF